MFTAHILNIACDLWRTSVASTGPLLLFQIINLRWVHRRTLYVGTAAVLLQHDDDADCTRSMKPSPLQLPRRCLPTAIKDRIEQVLTSNSTHFRSFRRRWGDCGISQDCSRSQSPQCVQCWVVCAQPLLITMACMCITAIKCMAMDVCFSLFHINVKCSSVKVVGSRWHPKTHH